VNSTDVALNVALNDPDVRQTLSRYDNHYVASYRQIDASSTKGFINYSGHLMGVYIQSTPPSGPPPLVNYYFIIDTNRSRIIDRASWLDLPPYDDVTIPPGSAWFHLVISATSSFGGIDAGPRTNMKSSYTPADANVTQTLVSEEGLHRLMNLAQTTPLRDLDVSKYVTVYNQTETLGSSWNATIRWQAREVIQGSGTGMSSEPLYRPDDSYYIVVINRESSRDVSLSQWAMTGSTM
jgi:hypothetical protein